MSSQASTIIGSRSLAWAIWLACVSMLAGFARGEEPAVSYRRILVPADRPATWPRGDAAYLPVESREFNDWIEAANAPRSSARIIDAEYEARLVDNNLVDGVARWVVVLRGEHPTRMPVGTTSVAFHDARWLGDPPAPAHLGWWPADEGKVLAYALDVPKSGELALAWQATGVPTASGGLQFALQLPIAARTRLTLDVPAGKRPVVDGGVALASPARAEEGGRWVLAISPTAPGVLRFEDTNPLAAPHTFASTVREDLRYDVSNSGVELQANLRLDAEGPAHEQLSVALPEGLQLIEAAAGTQPLTWRIVDSEEVGGPVRTTIQLPSSQAGGTVDISLRAWAPLDLDGSLRLPALAIDDAFWTSGTIELSIDGLLELNELVPIDCVQTTAETGEDSKISARRLQFTAFAPSAMIELALAHRPSRGVVRMGTALEVRNPGVAGRLVADVSVEQGSLHQLTADLKPGWSIDAVETIPASALGEWYVDRFHEPHGFELQLDRAVTPDQPVRIIVTGRLERATPLDPLQLASLSPFDWRNLSATRNLLQLRAADQFEIDPVGELAELGADGLSAEDRQLFSAPTAGRLCDLAAGSPTDAIRLVPKKGAYDATIQLDVALREDRLRQTHRIECRPHGSGIDHVLVYLSEAAAEPLQWADADSNEPLLAERMPASDPRLGGLPPGGELWLLHLRRLYAREITLTATSSTPWPRRRRVPLVSLPDAAAEQGRITISSAGVKLPTIVAQRMSPAPLPVATLVEPTSEAGEAIRAVYRFRPTRFYDAIPAAELWLGPGSARPQGSDLIASRVEVDSRFLADGTGTHHVTYHLENLGASSIELTLAADTHVESALLDGRPISIARGDRLTVALPAERPNSELELEITSRGSPLAVGGRLPSPLPQSSITLLAGQWIVSLPQGFAAIGADDAPASTPLDWREQLFGPLARRTGALPFNPLAAEDWNLLWAAFGRVVATPAQAAAAAAHEELTMPSGWQSFQFDFVGGPPVAITLDHRPAKTALALAIFLIVAVGAAICGVRGLTIVLAGVAAAGTSLLVPMLYAPLVTAVTLGLVAAALWRWWQVIIARRRLALTIVLVALVLSPVTAHAATPRAVESVLVPVDADGKTVGTKYFVTSEFLRDLLGAADGQSLVCPWLLTDMYCDGELEPKAEQAGVRAGAWTLTCELETFARDTTVTLPLVKREADWSSAASLDGMPAPITWSDSGHKCMVQIAEPGRHRLSIPFEPHVEQAGDEQRLALESAAGRGRGSKHCRTSDPHRPASCRDHQPDPHRCQSHRVARRA